jgi:hypothetical protein
VLLASTFSNAIQWIGLAAGVLTLLQSARGLARWLGDRFVLRRGQAERAASFFRRRRVLSVVQLFLGAAIVLVAAFVHHRLGTYLLIALVVVSLFVGLWNEFRSWRAARRSLQEIEQLPWRLVPGPGPTLQATQTAQPKGINAESGTDDLTRLIALKKGRTEIQAAALLRPYLGRTFTVSGEVYSVSDHPDPAGPSIGFEIGGVSVFMFFARADAGSLPGLNRGDRVAVRGTLNDTRIFTFTNCKLLDAQPGMSDT